MTRPKNVGLWRGLVRLTEAITILDMTPGGDKFVVALEPIREALLEEAAKGRRRPT